MKKLTIVSVVLAFFLITGIANAQNIAISDVSHTADASAVLDVYSTSLGMLVPRLSSAPSTPANGLFYYNTGSNSFFYNAGSSASPSWNELSYGNLWSTNGTDTYLTNPNDNLLVGTNSNLSGYRLYVHTPGPGVSTHSRIDGQVEFWNYTGPGNLLLADINDNGGAIPNGIMQLYFNGNAGIRLLANGSSFFKGGNVGIGANPATLLHVVDNNDLFAPQLQIDNPTALGAGNTSLGFNYVDATGVSMVFSEGIYGGTGDFEICKTPALVPSAQHDGATMMRAFPSGIIDLNNQSRARAFLTGNQNIQPSVWWPIDFSAITYDMQFEFTPGTGGTPASPAAYFTAKEEGYYQVNSRTEFFLGEEGNNFWVMQDAYVSIAIYKGTVQGTWSMYSQGNNLQIGGRWNPQTGEPMEELSFKHNNAPNVSDVVYLQKGESIAIYVWQSSGNMLDLIPGSAKTYVSIHKSS